MSANSKNVGDSGKRILPVNKDIQVEPSTTHQNLQSMDIANPGMSLDTAAQFTVLGKGIQKKMQQPIVFEEIKSSNDSSLIMNQNHRVRNPLIRQMNTADKTRKAFYSKMVQKVIRIMKDEELYQERTMLEREKHKQDLALHRIHLARKAKKFGLSGSDINDFGDSKKQQEKIDEEDEDDEESTNNEQKDKRKHHKSKRKAGFNSKQRIQNKTTFDKDGKL